MTGSQPVNAWKIINTIFFGGAFFPLYFLIVLIELKLLSPWLARHIRRLYGSGGHPFLKDWVLLITPVYLGVLYYLQYQSHRQPLIYAQIFPAWILFYYVGMLVKFVGFHIKPTTLLCSTALGLYLMMLESTFINEYLQIPFWAATQIKFSSAIFSLSLCLLLMSLHCEMKEGILVRLGEMSFGIYLLHLPVLKFVTIAYNGLCNSIGAVMIGTAVSQVFLIIATLSICFVLLSIAKKILPTKLNRYLGFQ